MKKKYNDKYRTSKKLLSGSDWYCHQAFRALNQAAGRCIRHKADYGAIILLDERFKGENYVSNMSKWLRKSVKEYDNFGMAMRDLENFFPVAKEILEAKYLNVRIPAFDNGHTSAVKATSISGSESNKERNRKEMAYNGCEWRVVSSDELTSPEGSELNKLSTAVRTNNFRTFKYNRYLEDESKGVPSFGNEQSSPTEELGIGQHACHSNGDQDGNFSATTPTPTPSECSDHQSYHSSHFVGPSGSEGVLSTVTPESALNADIPNHEAESSLNVSVNSCNQKMRSPIGLQLRKNIEVDVIRSLEGECVQYTYPISMYSTSKSEWRTECPFQASNSGVTDENVMESHPEGSCMESLAVKPASSDFVENSEKWSECHTSNILQLFCSFCGSPLGHAEKHHLMNFSFLSFSKPCLRNLLGTALPMSSFHESLTRAEQQTVSVIVADVNSVDQHLRQKRITGSGQNQAIWCKEDGCVFQPIYCPICNTSKPYLGLQVMETNLSNMDLQDKVMLFKDRISVKSHDRDQEEISTSADGSVLLPASESMLYKKSSSLVGSKRVGCVISKNSKLRLPRKVSDH